MNVPIYSDYTIETLMSNLGPVSQRKIVRLVLRCRYVLSKKCVRRFHKNIVRCSYNQINAFHEQRLIF